MPIQRQFQYLTPGYTTRSSGNFKWFLGPDLEFGFVKKIEKFSDSDPKVIGKRLDSQIFRLKNLSRNKDTEIESYSFQMGVFNLN